MSTKVKSILMRLLKGFISGALTSMIVIPVVDPNDWTQLITFVNVLVIAGIFGGINGAILAAQKWYSWTEVPPAGDYPPIG